MVMARNGQMATKAGRDHEVEPDGWASSASPSVVSSMIMGNSRQIGPCLNSGKVGLARRLTIEATVEL
jgi:hypothetical protein